MKPAGAPPDWYPDPDGSGGQRYWDGQRWTTQRPESSPPTPPSYSGSATELPPALPPNAPPAGWYDDPDGSGGLRWWDGERWMTPQPPQARGPAACRPHSVASVTLATFLGAPVAGGIVLALNYWKWGQKAAAVAAVAAGLFTTGIIFWLAWIVPSNAPGAIFWALQVAGAYFLAERLQGRRIGAYRLAGGQEASNWVGAGIGLAFTALFVGGFVALYAVSGTNFGAALEFDESVDMGSGQEVFYGYGVTREDAQRIGEALVETGYFDGTPTDVLISGRVGDREISFPVADGVWDDEFWVLWFRGLVGDIAPAIGGQQVTMRLLDAGWNEKKRLQFEFNTQPFVDMGQDQYVWYFRGATREDAQRVGEALIEDGYFDGRSEIVMIAGPASDRKITFYVQDGALEKESTVQWFREFSEDIAPAIGGGKPFTVRLLDGSGNQKHWLQTE